MGPSLPGSKYQTDQEVILDMRLAISLSLGKSNRHKPPLFARLEQLICCLLWSKWKFCYWLQQAKIPLQRVYYNMNIFSFLCVVRKLTWHLHLSRKVFASCTAELAFGPDARHLMMSCQKITGFNTASLTGEMALPRSVLHATASTYKGWKDGIHTAHALSSLFSNLQNTLLFRTWHI